MPATMNEIFELTFAGSPPCTVIPKLDQLAPDERQSVLCTICAMRKDIAANSESHSAEACQVLTAGVPPSLISLPPATTPSVSQFDSCAETERLTKRLGQLRSSGTSVQISFAVCRWPLQSGALQKKRLAPSA